MSNPFRQLALVAQAKANELAHARGYGACPMCNCATGYSAIGPDRGTYCFPEGPAIRHGVFVRAWRWFFGAPAECTEPGPHLHVYCRSCGWRWIANPRES